MVRLKCCTFLVSKHLPQQFPPPEGSGPLFLGVQAPEEMGNQKGAGHSIPHYLPPKGTSFISLNKITIRISRRGSQTIPETSQFRARAISPHIQPIFCINFKLLFLHLINSFLPPTFLPFHFCKQYTLLIIA